MNYTKMCNDDDGDNNDSDEWIVLFELIPLVLGHIFILSLGYE